MRKHKRFTPGKEWGMTPKQAAFENLILDAIEGDGEAQQRLLAREINLRLISNSETENQFNFGVLRAEEFHLVPIPRTWAELFEEMRNSSCDGSNPICALMPLAIERESVHGAVATCYAADAGLVAVA